MEWPAGSQLGGSQTMYFIPVSNCSVWHRTIPHNILGSFQGKKDANVADEASSTDDKKCVSHLWMWGLASATSLITKA